MIDDVLAIPEHIRDAVWRTDSAALKPFRADRLVVCGMGGSAVGGDLARGIIGDRLEGPLEVVRDELLPGWMGPDTAVLASSYSGNTSETLSAFRDAGRRGLHRWAVTTGGELGDLARSDGVGVVGMPGFLAPRASVAYVTTVAIMVAGLTGVAPDLREELEEAAESLAGSLETLRNQAAAIAEQIGDAPVVVHGCGATVAVARRWANQMNENAKLISFAVEVPEVAHNAIEAWARDGRGFAAVFLVDSELSDSDRRRLDTVAEMVGEAGASSIEVDAGGDSRSDRVFRSVVLGDLVSLELAQSQGVDPEPVLAIESFKQRVGGQS
jgi:glucose/mannose-6-phosphate isomerase